MTHGTFLGFFQGLLSAHLYWQDYFSCSHVDHMGHMWAAFFHGMSQGASQGLTKSITVWG